jgi:hypothetical protein
MEAVEHDRATPQLSAHLSLFAYPFVREVGEDG